MKMRVADLVYAKIVVTLAVSPDELMSIEDADGPSSGRRVCAGKTRPTRRVDEHIDAVIALSEERNEFG